MCCGMVDNFQTVQKEKRLFLDQIDTFGGGKVLFYADCGNNGKSGKSIGQARFKSDWIFVSLDRMY